MLTSAEVLQNRLREDFGSPIDTLRLQRRSLGNGYDGWDSVDGGGGGIYEPFAPEFIHNLGQLQSRSDVVGIICEGNLRRLADSFVGRNMDDTPDASLSIGLEDITNALLAFEVGFNGYDFGVLFVFSGSIGG